MCALCGCLCSRFALLFFMLLRFDLPCEAVRCFSSACAAKLIRCVVLLCVALLCVSLVSSAVLRFALDCVPLVTVLIMPLWAYHAQLWYSASFLASCRTENLGGNWSSVFGSGLCSEK